MKCPFESELQAGTMVCDYMGCKPPVGVKQCPTNIFNRCQSDEETVDLPAVDATSVEQGFVKE